MTTVGTHELALNSDGVHVFIPVTQHAQTGIVGNPVLSEGLYIIAAQNSWDDSWELTKDLLIEVRTSSKEVLAITYLTVQEYGVGASLETAILDLLTSLSDYYQSLEAREKTLDSSAREDLKRLRQLIRTRPAR
jgi:hypothetical protein